MSKARDSHACTCPSGDGSLRWPCPIHPALLPCPFCGAAAAVQNESPADNSGGYFVECKSCGASTNLRYACGDDPVPLLVAQWNARAPLKTAEEVDERALFEAVASDHGVWPKAIERDARGNYLLLTTANGWMWWQQARSSRTAPPQAAVQAEPVALQMCSDLKPRTESEKAAYLAGVADGRMYAERDAAKLGLEASLHADKQDGEANG